MPTIDAAYRELWGAVKTGIPFNTEAAIVKEWMKRYAEWGSPTGPERPLDGGGVYQVFTRAIVQWTSAGGVEVVVTP